MLLLALLLSLLTIAGAAHAGNVVYGTGVAPALTLPLDMPGGLVSRDSSGTLNLPGVLSVTGSTVPYLIPGDGSTYGPSGLWMSGSPDIVQWCPGVAYNCTDMSNPSKAQNLLHMVTQTVAPYQENGLQAIMHTATGEDRYWAQSTTYSQGTYLSAKPSMYIESGVLPSTSVTGTSSGTGGVVRLTVGSTAGMTTGDNVVVTGVTGTTEANVPLVPPHSTWSITVVDSTHIDLTGTVYTHAYVSGGMVAKTCLSAPTGTGPSGAVTGIADGTCTWDYVTTTYKAAKNLLGLLATGDPGGGRIWLLAAGYQLNYGWAGNAAFGTEFDLGNFSGTDAAYWGTAPKVWGAYFGGTTGMPNSGAILIGTQPTDLVAGYGMHWGILFNGTHTVKDADIAFYNNGATNGVYNTSQFGVAFLRDVGQSQYGAYFSGTYSVDAIKAVGDVEVQGDTSNGNIYIKNVDASQSFALSTRTGVNGAFAIYDATHSRSPFIVFPTANENTLVVNSVGIAVGGQVTVQGALTNGSINILNNAGDAEYSLVTGSSKTFSLYDATMGKSPLVVYQNALASALSLTTTGATFGGTVTSSGALTVNDDVRINGPSSNGNLYISNNAGDAQYAFVTGSNKNFSLYDVKSLSSPVIVYPGALQSNLTLTTTGALFGGTVTVGTTTYAASPVCNAGAKTAMVNISDATVNTFGATISAGGGGNSVLARCNGTRWTVAGY